MPLISERTTHAGARGKSLPREENRSRREETRARKLNSNTCACGSLRAIQALAQTSHLLARTLLFLSVMGQGLLV